MPYRPVIRNTTVKKILLLLALAAVGVCSWKFLFPPNPSVAAPGAHLATDPVQTPSSQPPFQKQGYTISTLANYELDARVLSIRSYDRDQGADLIPFDLALGWGPMSDPKKLSNVSFTQSDRKYYWHISKLPSPTQDIIRYSANTHIIPANPQVRAAIAQLNAGQLISLHGRLVNVAGPTGWRKNSSLTRGDTGPGADEVFYVESAIPFFGDPSHNDLLAFPTPTRTDETSPTYSSQANSSTTRTVNVYWPVNQYSAMPPVHLPSSLATTPATSTTRVAPSAPTVARIQSAPATVSRPAPAPRVAPPAARAPTKSSTSSQ